MKLLNKKGFALVETLIVTAFVMTIFIFTYQNLVPLIGEYEKMDSYDDIDSVYAANLYKQVILNYTNLNYIDSYLQNHTYLDITDCSNTNIYTNNNYCSKMKQVLNIAKDDYIFITRYDISNFREELKENEFFDSGKLSNFKSYVNTIGDIDSFYDPTDNNQSSLGKYRLFITRTVVNTDQSTSLKYVNLGIFLGKYSKYNAGEKVIFNPGDGNKEFYVLKTSNTNESLVTLILANNLEGTTVFNTTGNNSLPVDALALLKTKTDSWNNVEALTDTDNFVSTNGYTISYNGYHARLLNENDIYLLLGCENSKSCFDISSLFSVLLNDNLSWLYNGLSNDNGYWLANSVLNSNDMAWTIKNSKITPEVVSNNTLIGVRPVVIVSKDSLIVGDEHEIE